MRHTLDEYARNDPKILRVYSAARRIYGKENRYHHNFNHVLRDLYRALAIGTDEGPVDYSILIPSVLLHDIGFSDPSFEHVGHDVAGALLAEKLLVDLGYGKTTIKAISHCIRAHKGKAELPETLEAKILYDADVLEKSGLVYLIWGGKIVCEFEETVEDFLKREVPDRTKELKKGFYTRKGRELDGGRLAQVKSLLSQTLKEIQQERPDYQVKESDLWEKPIPEGAGTGAEPGL
ncbi:MAG: HD domain-containing protein [Desulfobacteraceae bacterium]|nr:HD domain-containing protein [Desulfobacteraceae bacterium]